MPAVIPFIPLIVGGVTAGTTAYVAHEQGQAADTQANAVTHSADVQAQAQRDATAAQTRASQAALDIQVRERNDRVAALGPYRNAGTNAFTALSGSMGLPSDQSATPAPTPWTVPDLSPTPTTPSGQAVATTPTSLATLAPTSTAAQSQPTGAAPTDGTLAALAPAQAQTGSSYVRMVAPNGQVENVPVAWAAHYAQKGARRVA